MITINDASGCSISEKISINNKNTIGFDELMQQNSYGINVVPNPAKGSVKISFATINNKNIKITLYDIMGKVKYQTEEKINSEFYSKEINFSLFTRGIYFLKVRNGESETVRKIVITK